MDTEMDTSEAQIGRSIEVLKALQVELDVGTLLVSDTNEVNVRSLKSNPEEYLKTLTRENTQLLVNEIWKIPFERVDDVIITKLPTPTYILPREKPAPKPKAPSKWESYAKEKGITKRKKTKLIWDEMVKKWVPRYGYRKAEVEHEKDWLLEVPGGADPMEDQFEKKSENKAEKVSKNELQRLKNLARSKNINVPQTGLISKEKSTKLELNQAVHVAKKATASLGKFQPSLGKKEKPLKGGNGRKRLFEPLVMDSMIEKNKNLDVLAKIMNKKPKIDMERAVTRHMSSEDPERSAFRPKGGKTSGGGGRRSEGKRRTGKDVNAKTKRVGGGSTGGSRGRSAFNKSSREGGEGSGSSRGRSSSGGRGGGGGRGRGGGGGRGRGGGGRGRGR